MELSGRSSINHLGGETITILGRPALYLTFFKAITHALKADAVHRRVSHRIGRGCLYISKKTFGLASEWNYEVWMACRCIGVLGTEAEETRTTVECRLRTTTALCTVLICTCDVFVFFGLDQPYSHGRSRLHLTYLTLVDGKAVGTIVIGTFGGRTFQNLI